jgi:hypothetical protein
MSRVYEALQRAKASARGRQPASHGVLEHITNDDALPRPEGARESERLTFTGATTAVQRIGVSAAAPSLSPEPHSKPADDATLRRAEPRRDFSPGPGIQADTRRQPEPRSAQPESSSAAKPALRAFDGRSFAQLIRDIARDEEEFGL